MSDKVSSWAVGWAVFAAVMMTMVGVFHIVAGLVALFNDTFYVVGQEWIFEFDVTSWGWIHLLWGVVMLLAAFGILRGNVVGRIVGVIAAALSAIVNFTWLPYQPVWSTIMIAVAVSVIWALTVHGRDVQAS